MKFFTIFAVNKLFVSWKKVDWVWSLRPSFVLRNQIIRWSPRCLSRYSSAWPLEFIVRFKVLNFSYRYYSDWTSGCRSSGLRTSCRTYAVPPQYWMCTFLVSLLPKTIPLVRISCPVNQSLRYFSSALAPQTMFSRIYPLQTKRITPRLEKCVITISGTQTCTRVNFSRFTM